MSEMRDQTEEIINLFWDPEQYYMVAAGEDAPSSQQLVDLAAEYGVQLPADYLAHATGWLGGLYIEVREELWPRPKEFEVGPFWSFLYGVFVYACSDEAPDWLQIRVAADEFKQMGHRALPFLKVVGDADVYCFDPDGGVVRWSHEEDTFEPQEATFFDVLRSELLELDNRRKRKVEERSES